MNESWLVAGIGSPFGADRFGWRVVDALQDLAWHARVRLVSCRTPAELPAMLLQSQRAILIDALLDQTSRGRLSWVATGQLSAQRRLCATHGFSLGDAVAMAASVGWDCAGLSVLALAIDSPEAPLEARWIESAAHAVRVALFDESALLA